MPKRGSILFVGRQPREAGLQAACEELLERLGYWRRTVDAIAAGPPPRGWFVHVPRAKGNPILLDLLILGNDGRFAEIELKTETGRVARHQKQLIAQGPNRYLVRTMDAMVLALRTHWVGERS